MNDNTFLLITHEQDLINHIYESGIKYIFHSSYGLLEITLEGGRSKFDGLYKPMFENKYEIKDIRKIWVTNGMM